MPRVSLVLPCYNEIEHIESSLARIHDFLSFCFDPTNFEIILVDDGSVDGTREWLKEKSLPKACRVILNEKNLGRGGAVKVGLQAAKGDSVGFMDIDCEVSESYLAKFVQCVENGNDFVFANRIYKVKPSIYVLFRHTLSVVYRWVLQQIVGIQTVDTEAGYKFFSNRAAKLVVERSKFNGWFFDTEVSYIAEKSGAKIIEPAVTYIRRTDKTSTVRSIRDSFLHLKDLRIFLKYKSQNAYASLQLKEPEKHLRFTS